MYTSLAGWFHLITHPDDYAEEAETYLGMLSRATKPPLKTVLELGSGGGNNALHMKRHFQLTLTDLSQDMLDLSRTINPELEHIQGDMRTLRLGRTFDAVFVHDAVSYMTTEHDLRAAVETAYIHTRPGGGALFAPDWLREHFRPGEAHGGHDGDDGRALRYLEWTWDPDPNDNTYLAEYAYLLREANGSVRVVHDRHTEGLFPRDTWLRLLAETGYNAEPVPFEHSELQPGLHEFFAATRPT
jgi:SAM-dependent methyltransferase